MHRDRNRSRARVPMGLWRPFFFVGGPVALAILLETSYPCSIHLPPGLRILLSVALVSSAAVQAVRTLVEFFRFRTPFRVDRAARALIVTGPFRRSRNPLYLAMFLALFGAGFAFDSVWMLAAALYLPSSITLGLIEAEERFLRDRFGQDYRDYSAEVPRWI